MRLKERSSVNRTDQIAAKYADSEKLSIVIGASLEPVMNFELTRRLDA